MNRKTLLVFSIISLSLAAAAAKSLQTARSPAAKTADVTIPFELISRHIVLQVNVNNSRPLSFILDTGDKVAVIDADRAKELGLNLQGQIRVGGAGSELLTGSFVRGSKWTIPALEGFDQPVTLALPLGRLAARLGHDFDGLIGSDFIKQFVVEIDYQARQIKLHDKEKFSYSGSGQSIPIQLNSQGHPFIDAEITPVGADPIKGKFVLDIGSGGALALYSPLVTKYRLLSSDLKTIKAIGAGGAGGQTTGQIGRVAELKIGNFRIARPITLFSQDKSGAFASTEIAGNIGEQIASKFKVFLDYNHERVILEPNATFARPFDRAHGGLALVTEGKDYTTFRITDVLENSPASEAGLQKNDIITAINGKPAAELTLSRLVEMFEQEASYRLTIRRADQTLEVTLKPRKLV